MATIGTDIKAAAGILKSGHVVAIPTETVYGLAANALNIDAVNQIFSVKERPHSNPLIIHLANRTQLDKYVKDVPEALEPLLEQFWPGPLTVLLTKKDTIPDQVNAGLNKVAVRIPNHELTLSLLSLIDLPLAAPSANPFGYISPTQANHVQDQLGSKIQYILDGGACNVGLESTIVGLEGEHLIVYRLGGISMERLAEYYDGIVSLQNQKDHTPDAPGMLPYHYSPKTQLVLVNDLSEINSDPQKTGLIFYTEEWDNHVYTSSTRLESNDDFTSAGRKIYETLYELDRLDLDLIAVQRFPNIGLGRTINDRLTRAGRRRE